MTATTDVDIPPDYWDRLKAVQPRDLPPEVDIFDEHTVRKGARLNRAAYSLKDEPQRRLFHEDQGRWMDQFGLTPEEREMIRNQDWIGLWRSGMSIYVMTKLAATMHTSLVAIGQQMKEVR